jgi:hypothetical protein
MMLRHEVALVSEDRKRFDAATLAAHHAVHQGAREIGVGLVVLGFFILLAASLLAHKGE